jgi:4'-phosphopantetheinyl transferase
VTQAEARSPVIVRWCDLQACRRVVHRLDRFLSPQERGRRERFRYAEDAERFTLARALCRISLAPWCGTPPEEIAFELGTHGKPALEGGPSFNLSDSGDLVVMAIGSEGDLGVDVERIVDHDDLPQLAARYFAEEEHRFLRRLSDRAQRIEAFYAIWTVKEASLKAVGGGLSIPLDAACVSMPSREGRIVLNTPDAAPANLSWKRLRAPLPDYALAIARREQLGEVRLEAWRPPI